MVAATMVRATYGVGGVIYTDGRCERSPDQPRWLTDAFRPTAATRQISWQGDDMFVVTCQNALQTRMSPGRDVLPLPVSAQLAGVAMGHFFQQGSPEFQPAPFSARLLADFHQRGPSAFKDVNGSWICVIWDRTREVAHFVRDGVGSYRLYAMRLPGRIVFTTDLRLFRTAGFLGAVDEQAVAEFLHYLYIPPPRTVAENCEAVLAGHVLTMSRSTSTQERYIGPRFVAGTSLPPLTDVRREAERHLPEFEDALMTAVRDCLPPTGKVVLPLSGGQDSSTLAIALSKLCPERVLAFTVGERDPRLSEARDAAMVANALGLEHQLYTPSDTDLAEGLNAFIGEHDQPIGDPASLPFFLGMSKVPDEYGLIIYGAGNDDYFGVSGRDKYLKYKLRADVSRVVPSALFPALRAAMSLGPAGLRRLSKAWDKPIEESYVSWFGWSAEDLARLFQRPISFAGTELWKLMHRTPSSQWRELSQEVVGGLWEPQTGYVKAMQFAHALGKGICFPFLDSRLKEIGYALPLELKLDKQILLAYMAKSLPAAIVDKPKGSFTFDLNRLFLNPKGPWADQLKSRGDLQVLPSWDAKAVQDLVQAHSAAPHVTTWQHRLYGLCVLAAYFQMANVPSRRQANN